MTKKVTIIDFFKTSYLSHSLSLRSCLSTSRPSSNSLYHGLFCIHSFTSLQPCSAITPAILRSSSGVALSNIWLISAVPKKCFLPLAVCFVYPFNVWLYCLIWLSYPSLITLFEFAKAETNISTIGSSWRLSFASKFLRLCHNSKQSKRIWTC